MLGLLDVLIITDSWSYKFLYSTFAFLKARLAKHCGINFLFSKLFDKLLNYFFNHCLQPIALYIVKSRAKTVQYPFKTVKIWCLFVLLMIMHSSCRSTFHERLLVTLQLPHFCSFSSLTVYLLRLHDILFLHRHIDVK